jgi:hypothetical protein
MTNGVFLDSVYNQAIFIVFLCHHLPTQHETQSGVLQRIASFLGFEIRKGERGECLSKFPHSINQ